MTQRRDDDATDQVSSPACSMHEADDAYMGYAEKDELTALLNELLEAERAGVRVTFESARGGPGGRILDHDDFGSNRSKVINVIDSNSLEWDAGEKVLTLFLIPL